MNAWESFRFRAAKHFPCVASNPGRTPGRGALAAVKVRLLQSPLFERGPARRLAVGAAITNGGLTGTGNGVHLVRLQTLLLAPGF